MDLKTLDILKIEATELAGLFAGGAIFINIVDIPAIRKVTDTDAARRYWKESFLRAAKWQASIALVSSATAGAVYYMDESEKRYLWLVGAGLFSTIFPWTLFVMKPDINKLLEDDVIQKRGGDWVRTKIESWNKRHMFRTVMSWTAFGLFLYALKS